MSTDPIRLERRSGQRFELQSSLAIHFDGKTARGFTQDLSGRGIFFYTEAVLAVGGMVELTFTMPSEITLAESMRVRCRGRVLRASVPQEGQKNGFAVQLESYEYLPATEAASAAGCTRASASPGVENPRPVPR